ARDPGRPGQNTAAPPRRSLAVDGKTVRGARRADGTQLHLLAAMTGTRLVTAQREVGCLHHCLTQHVLYDENVAFPDLAQQQRPAAA
ncbi:hypothetical protein ACWD4L_46440, partial [Streptomyces sp. NPDC002596]